MTLDYEELNIDLTALTLGEIGILEDATGKYSFEDQLGVLSKILPGTDVSSILFTQFPRVQELVKEAIAAVQNPTTPVKG